MAMAKVGQVGRFSIYVFSPSRHDNNYVKVKGKGGEDLGKFRLDSFYWEKNMGLSPADKKKIVKWVEDHLGEINKKIKYLERK
jgi:hypothetical protein